ncbi:MAG: type II toxin-antitoxin system HicB family antitoxin [Clostridia bacterium]|nr:type II toxin-antitoxin system HicB family antitoxin [Clostridia bacterium]
MQQYVFPAILYKDPESKGYTVVFHDINLCTEGETVEDAFLRAKEFLEVYCRCAMEYNGEVEIATKYEDVETDKKNIVLLVDAEIEINKKGVKEDKFNLGV